MKLTKVKKDDLCRGNYTLQYNGTNFVVHKMMTTGAGYVWVACHSSGAPFPNVSGDTLLMLKSNVRIEHIRAARRKVEEIELRLVELSAQDRVLRDELIHAAQTLYDLKGSSI